MEWPFKQNFSTCTFTRCYLFLLFVCHILPLATFGRKSNFASEFHILNGTVALICFVVVVFLTASSGLVHPLVLVEDSIECSNPNSITSAGASR